MIEDNPNSKEHEGFINSITLKPNDWLNKEVQGNGGEENGRIK